MNDGFVFEGTFDDLLRKAVRQKTLTIKDIVWFMKELQSMESDSHICIAGQNGTGKSYLMLMILKEYLGRIDDENLFLADKTSNDIITFLLTHEDTILAIDELNLNFSYKMHATKQQNHLINSIELARSKRIPIAGCIRDPRKLTLNYRNSKVAIILFILDRWKKGKGAYAAILIGNPMLEGEDRFGLAGLDITSFNYDEMRYQLESLPSFVGYMRIPPINDMLSEDEISGYRKAKETAMAKAHLNYLKEQAAKKKISPDDLEKELAVLEKIIPGCRSMMPKPQKKLDGFIDDD